jgi:L-asparaginase
MVISMIKKRILIVFTGGTISMEKHIESKLSIISNNQLQLLEKIKNEIKQVDLETYQFSLKPSPSITAFDMLSLAKIVSSSLENASIDGVVITHGTDTLEETAYFLDLYVHHEKPVVMTGSMRNFSELGYDGLSNLVSSILVAASDASKKRGVLLCMNDEINAASEVTKSHTLALDTFKSLEFGPIGIVDQERVLYYRETHSLKLSKVPESIEDRVEIIKAYAGSSSLLLNLLVDSKIKGIVIEALGRGNVPPQMVPGIIRAIENNIPVVLTSRCPKGRVLDTYGYEGGGRHLKDLGVIFVENLNSQKARIKLMFALTLHSTILDIRKFFENTISDWRSFL